MAEYIDREALYEKAYWHGRHPDVGNPFPDGVDAIDIKDVDAIPAADVAPVVHGRWKEMHYEGGILDGTNFDRCSICGYERVFDDPSLKTVFKYCPNCGAKMDGGAE